MKTRWVFLSIVIGVLIFNALLLTVIWVLRSRSHSVVHEQRIEPINQPKDRAVAQRYVAEGFALKKKRQFADAIAAFQNAIGADPDFSDSYHGLAQTQREAGDATTALANHDRAIQLDPERHDLYWERGATYMRLRNYDAAITNFEACLERNGVFANAQLGLGEAYQNKGEFQKALQHHNEAIAMKPDSAWFYRERGNTYRKMGNQPLAEADFAKARELEQQGK